MCKPSFFEKIAPVYEVLTRMFMLGTFTGIRKRILSEDTSEMKVLDLCCGTGYITNTIQAKEIVGVDFSDAMLAINAKKERPNKTLIKGNAYHLEGFENSTFDRIYNTSASHEFKRFDMIIERAGSLLKSGGKFYLYDIYKSSNFFYKAVVNTVYRYIVEHNFMWVHSKEEWIEMFAKAGFEIEELDIKRGIFIYIVARKN